jgi:hypothetical protein
MPAIGAVRSVGRHDEVDQESPAEQQIGSNHRLEEVSDHAHLGADGHHGPQVELQSRGAPVRASHGADAEHCANVEQRRRVVCKEIDADDSEHQSKPRLVLHELSTLNVQVLEGYAPQIGDEHVILTASSVSGTFGAIESCPGLEVLCASGARLAAARATRTSPGRRPGSPTATWTPWMTCC